MVFFPIVVVVHVSHRLFSTEFDYWLATHARIYLSEVELKWLSSHLKSARTCFGIDCHSEISLLFLASFFLSHVLLLSLVSFFFFFSVTTYLITFNASIWFFAQLVLSFIVSVFQWKWKFCAVSWIFGVAILNSSLRFFFFAFWTERQKTVTKCSKPKTKEFLDRKQKRHFQMREKRRERDYQKNQPEYIE